MKLARVSLKTLYSEKSARLRKTWLRKSLVVPQHKAGLCGPYALGYALMSLGIDPNFVALVKDSGATCLDGVNEFGLRHAAKLAGCHFVETVRRKPKAARNALESVLRRGPAVLAVDEWYHWLTVVHGRDGKFIVLDPEPVKTGRVLRVYTWDRLQKYWKFDNNGQQHSVFAMYSVRPRRRTEKFRPSFYQ